MAANGASTGPLTDDIEMPEPSAHPGPVKKTQAAAATELVSNSNTDTCKKQWMKTVSAAAASECSIIDFPAASITKTWRPLLPRVGQPIPISGKRMRMSSQPPPARDPRRDLPTVVKPEDPPTAESESVASPRDKALVREAARSTVSISSVTLDGKVRYRCTGIFIGWKETNKCARVLTSSLIVFEIGPNIKLHIGLPNRTVLEGQLLFFNNYYDIALLEISSESDLPLQLPSFGSNPNYGQEVFILARGKDSNLMARHGRVSWFEDPKSLQRNYLMLLSCDTPDYGTGGPVIDHDGSSVIGMAFQNIGPGSSVIAISTILTCIEMWMKFSRIARPMHGLSLRTVELLDVSLQEVISLDHKINNGYIVDKVSIGSAAEKLGIRYGDVIVSFDGLRDQTLPQLEDYLLSLGWGHLQGITDSNSTVDLKLEVYDLLERGTRSVTLSVGFCE